MLFAEMIVIVIIVPRSIYGKGLFLCLFIHLFKFRYSAGNIFKANFSY